MSLEKTIEFVNILDNLNNPRRIRAFIEGKYCNLVNGEIGNFKPEAIELFAFSMVLFGGDYYIPHAKKLLLHPVYILRELDENALRCLDDVKKGFLVPDFINSEETYRYGLLRGLFNKKDIKEAKNLSTKNRAINIVERSLDEYQIDPYHPIISEWFDYCIKQNLFDEKFLEEVKRYHEEKFGKSWNQRISELKIAV